MAGADQPGRGLALLGVGFSFGAVVGAMIWVGYEADAWLHTRPWLLLAGALLGVALATYDLIKTVTAFEKRNNDQGS